MCNGQNFFKIYQNYLIYYLSLHQKSNKVNSEIIKLLIISGFDLNIYNYNNCYDLMNKNCLIDVIKMFSEHKLIVFNSFDHIIKENINIDNIDNNNIDNNDIDNCDIGKYGNILINENDFVMQIGNNLDKCDEILLKLLECKNVNEMYLIEMFKLLISLGANTAICDNDNKNLLDIATKNKNYLLRDFLITLNIFNNEIDNEMLHKNNEINYNYDDGYDDFINDQFNNSNDDYSDYNDKDDDFDND